LVFCHDIEPTNEHMWPATTIRAARLFGHQHCNQGVWQGSIIPRAPNHYGAPNDCGRRRKVPTVSQVLSAMQQQLLSKAFRFDHGGANLFLVPGAI